MKSLSKTVATAVAMMVLSAPAHADYIFSAIGSSGNFTGQASEPYIFNADGGQAVTGYLDNWGSPGVGAGVTAYLEADQAYGLLLTFSGASINAASITIGNGAGCAGSTSGGTTFCTLSPTDIWTASLNGTDSIAFLAQDPSFYLTNGQNYFVNVFFDGSAPRTVSGTWLTSFTPTLVPEPITLSVFGIGVAGALVMRRRKKNAA